MIELKECKRLSARISEQQCERNRGRIISCMGCEGLGQVAAVVVPVREERKMPTNKKKYICSVEGCGRSQQKNKLCYLHNKQAEAEKHGSFVSDTPSGDKAAKQQPAAAQSNPAQPPTNTGLSSLLRVPVPPPVVDGILIPFTKDETVALIAAGIGAEDIRQLTLYLLAGELVRVAEDAAA